MMSAAIYDVYAIGNALVDTEVEVSEDLLRAAGVQKRHMTLIDPARRAELLQHVQGLPMRQTGGGSAGNTVVAVAQFGAKAFYSCRVAEDGLGHFYAQDLAAHGVDSNLRAGQLAPGETGSCLVMVTPDAERSMSTCLGATAELDGSALDLARICQSKIYYMEGYLAASPTGLAAALQGRAVAAQSGVALAATLSDVSMINFCRSGLEQMVGTQDSGRLSYLFANEEEAQVWCATTDFDQICQMMQGLAQVVCITRSAKGCVVLQGGVRTDVAGMAVKALDTNGAGDMFAGAFLYAVATGSTSVDAAGLANVAAAHVVAQYGNRLGTALIQAIKAHSQAGVVADV